MRAYTISYIWYIYIFGASATVWCVQIAQSAPGHNGATCVVAHVEFLTMCDARKVVARVRTHTNRCNQIDGSPPRFCTNRSRTMYVPRSRQRRIGCYVLLHHLVIITTNSARVSVRVYYIHSRHHHRSVSRFGRSSNCLIKFFFCVLAVMPIKRRSANELM